MRKLAFISGLSLCGMVFLTGCSQSTTQTQEPIKGMAPAEYREKAEMSREIQPAQPGTKKAMQK